MIRINSKDKILVVAPHPDDESLGCGGLMLELAKQIDSFCFLSSGIAPNAKSKSETRISEWNAAQEFIGCNNLGIVELYGKRPLLPRIIENMPEYLNKLKTSQYDYIFMPNLNDNHPEHQYISGKIMRDILLINGYKKNLKIVFYEIWKILEHPNYFFPINAERKMDLLALYKTQWSKCNLPKKILGLNCYRGIDADFKEYAEAFEVNDMKTYFKKVPPYKKHICKGKIFKNILLRWCKPT